ncbi:MAG: hypothetical protein QJR00_05325 [Bacillota bacterium]|nr:hypothetical protein [Bacillota bacterium]
MLLATLDQHRLAWIGVIVEFLGAEGLDSSCTFQVFNFSYVYAGILLVALLASSMYVAFQALENRYGGKADTLSGREWPSLWAEPSFHKKNVHRPSAPEEIDPRSGAGDLPLGVRMSHPEGTALPHLRQLRQLAMGGRSIG